MTGQLGLTHVCIDLLNVFAACNGNLATSVQVYRRCLFLYAGAQLHFNKCLSIVWLCQVSIEQVELHWVQGPVSLAIAHFAS